MRMMKVAFIVGIYSLVLQGCKSQRCRSQILTDLEGVISSPNHPAVYPPNSFCMFTISAPAERVVELTFTSFRLQRRLFNDIPTDYVEVQDGTSVDGIQTYTGALPVPFKFTSETNKVTVTFISNMIDQYPGFRAEYKMLKKIVPVGCNVTLLQANNLAKSCPPSEFPGLSDSCNVTCSANYTLANSNTTVACVNDTWKSQPMCKLVPSIVQQCYQTLLAESKCPYSMDELVAHVKSPDAVVDSPPDDEDIKTTRLIGRIQKKDPLRGRAVTKPIKCPTHMCQVSIQTKTYLYKCNDSRFKTIFIVICLKCRFANRCSGSVTIF